MVKNDDSKEAFGLQEDKVILPHPNGNKQRIQHKRAHVTKTMSGCRSSHRPSSSVAIIKIKKDVLDKNNVSSKSSVRSYGVSLEPYKSDCANLSVPHLRAHVGLSAPCLRAHTGGSSGGDHVPPFDDLLRLLIKKLNKLGRKDKKRIQSLFKNKEWRRLQEYLDAL